MTTKKLNLVQLVLKRARHLHDSGVGEDAGRLFHRLLALAELPQEVAEEIQGRLAEIRFDQGRFRRARRHLAAALAYQPDNAHYHYMMALAAEADPDCPLERAYKHFRRAVQLDPEHPEYLCGLGLTALDLGRPRDGLQALRRAQRLAPDDLGVLEKVVEGLGEEGAWEEAKGLVRAALFRHPRDGAFRQLWQRLEFTALVAQQEAAQAQRRHDQKKADLLAFIVPFNPPVAHGTQGGNRFIRHDAPSLPLGPKKTKRPTPKKTF